MAYIVSAAFHRSVGSSRPGSAGGAVGSAAAGIGSSLVASAAAGTSATGSTASGVPLSAVDWPKSFPQPPQNLLLPVRCRPHLGQKFLVTYSSPVLSPGQVWTANFAFIAAALITGGVICRVVRLCASVLQLLPGLAHLLVSVTARRKRVLAVSRPAA
jgi:hypothetical protein